MSSNEINPRPKRSPGRPSSVVWPEKIDAHPDQIASAFLRKPPAKWEYQSRLKEPSR